MISKISISALDSQASLKSSPSFGFAKLNTKGREIADSFGYTENSFVNSQMFKKQGLFKKSLLTKELENHASFANICTEYGCTKNPKANADFIVNQVLNNKSKKALSRLNRTDFSDGLQALYLTNYDNPELSTVNTKRLLLMLHDTLSPEDYVKNIGLLDVGTAK